MAERPGEEDVSKPLIQAKNSYGEFTCSVTFIN